MDLAQIIEVGSATAGLGGLVFALGRFVESVKANTKATESLSTVIDKHLTWSAEVVREHDERFHDHDTRLTRVEERLDKRR